MMKDTGLLIIDMQSEFKAANDTTVVANVILEIKKAKQNNQHIFVVEYWEEGDTHKSILKELKDYQNTHFVTKYEDDGSDKIKNYLFQNNIDIKHFMVCGVNTCACVASTVKGLIENYNKICTVIEKACNCITTNHNHNGLRPIEVRDNFDNEEYDRYFSQLDVNII